MRLLRTLPLTLLALLTACGTARGAAQRPAAPEVEARQIALVQTATGVSGVTAGTGAVEWSATSAAAAPDGSALFGTSTDGTLTERNPRTGAALHTWSVPRGLAPVVVAPGGTVVVLSDRPIGYDSEATPRAATHVVVVDGWSGTVVHDLHVAGDIEPEAFSIDRSELFVLDHRGNHYRVQQLDLASGERTDVIDQDKNPGEDMRGRPVHGVMSSDHQQLATLYINPDNATEPAFVHVLNLTGWSFCLELPDDFANGPARSQSIERTTDDHIVVRAPAIDRNARFDLSAIADGQDPRLAIGTSAGAPLDAPYRAINGFQSLIAILPADGAPATRDVP